MRAFSHRFVACALVCTCSAHTSICMLYTVYCSSGASASPKPHLFLKDVRVPVRSALSAGFVHLQWHARRHRRMSLYSRRSLLPPRPPANRAHHLRLGTPWHHAFPIFSAGITSSLLFTTAYLQDMPGKDHAEPVQYIFYSSRAPGNTKTEAIPLCV